MALKHKVSEGAEKANFIVALVIWFRAASSFCFPYLRSG